MIIPLIFIHGYSDSEKGFAKWGELLIKKRNLDRDKVFFIGYQSLVNEVTIRDIAEGFNRALSQEVALQDEDAFDVIVHSTGMLVIRAWLTRYAPLGGLNPSPMRSARDQNRIRRLRHLIALAPATNGSPVAHKGRSWLGALAKGSKDFGPDFLESGHQVLSALELGSSFTWDLAEKDMFGGPTNNRFKKGPESPYVFTICGDSGLGGVADFATDLIGTKTQGSDGVVRWAGAALNCRRLTIDYTGEAGTAGTEPAGSPITVVSDWSNQDNILVLWPGLNHGTIMRPVEGHPLVELVSQALDVQTPEAFTAWNASALQRAELARAGMPAPHQWQQLVIRVVDERGDGVSDWAISLRKTLRGKAEAERVKIDDLHPYERDKSYRCLHLDLTENGLDDPSKLSLIESFEMRLFMNTNSRYMIYAAQCDVGADFSGNQVSGMSELNVDLTSYVRPGGEGFKLLMSYTTTFVEFRVNRDPSLDAQNRPRICAVKNPLPA